MKTLEEIKAEIIAANPSRKYELNGEIFEQTDDEFVASVKARAEMELAQLKYAEELKSAKEAKVSGYKKLGLSDDEIIAIVGLSDDEAKILLSDAETV
jgi:hypothetical protein